MAVEGNKLAEILKAAAEHKLEPLPPAEKARVEEALARAGIRVQDLSIEEINQAFSIR